MAKYIKKGLWLVTIKYTGTGDFYRQWGEGFRILEIGRKLDGAWLDNYLHEGFSPAQQIIITGMVKLS